MRELQEGQTQSRPGRCATHPAAASVGSCEVCGRALCVACAVPVRGTLVGRECLGEVLEDAPPLEGVPSPIRQRGGRLALIGFGLVVLTSVLPWSRFGDSSRYLGAWTLNLSLIAAVAGVAGLALALFVTYRPLDARAEGSAFGVLGMLIVIAAVLQHRHPPLLSEATYWPWVAALGGALGIVAGGLKLRAVRGAGRANG